LARRWGALGDVVAQRIAGVGVVPRVTRGSRLAIRADWGRRRTKWGVPGLGTDPGTFKAYGEGRLHASVACIF